MKMTKPQQLIKLLYNLKVELGNTSKTLSETKSYNKILALFDTCCKAQHKHKETAYKASGLKDARSGCIFCNHQQKLPSFEVFRDWEGVKDEGDDFVSFKVDRKTGELIKDHQMVSTDSLLTIFINRGEYELASKSPEEFKRLIRLKLPKP